MKPIGLALVAFIGLLMCVALAGAVTSVAGQLSEPTYAELVADQVRADQLERQNELDAQYAPLRAAFLAFVVVAATLGLMAYAGGLAAAHVRRTHLERMPNSAGLLPVLASDQATARAALSAFHGARQIEAARQLVPEHYAPHITYSPHHELEYSYKGEGGPLLPGAEVRTATVPAFAALLDAGRIGPGQPLLLGHDLATGEGVWGDWKDLYSAGLGGKQGSGKSWTAASLISQSLLGGARVVLCDPHAGDEESLTTRLEPLVPAMELVADDSPAILQAARYVGDEFRRRRELAKAKQPYDKTPLILVLDEWTSLLRGKLGEKLPEILADLTTEGRKYGVNALLLAQRWEAEAAGGSDVRNTLTAFYVHRMRGDEARMMTGMRSSALPDDTLSLQPGQAYLFDTRGRVLRVATPTMSGADLARVAQLLGGGPPQFAASAAASAERAIGFRTPAREVGSEVGSEAATSAHQDAVEPWTPEEARIVALLAQGKGPREVVIELYDVKGGDRYTEAAAKVTAVIARLARRRG